MPSESLQYLCMEAAKSVIEALDLDGIDDDSIVIRKLPIDRRLGPDVGHTPLPAILLAPDMDRMDPRAPPVGVNEIIIGTLVCVVAADNQDLEANGDLYFQWREAVWEAFHNQRLAGLSAVVNGWVEPREVVNQAAWKQNIFSSALVLRHQCWKARP